MKNKLILLLSLLPFYFSAMAQSDTTFYYWNKEGKSTTKDSAVSYGILYPEGGKYRKKEFKQPGNRLYFDGTYLDSKASKQDGEQKWYSENGKLDMIINYRNGEAINKTFYYESGAKKSSIIYKDNQQQAWDENGNPLQDFIVEKAAEVPKGWAQYIARSLKANIAAEEGLPAGFYTVKVRFDIDKEGNIINVVATDPSKGCSGCAAEAIRVISHGPKWTPAIQNNQLVKFRVVQPVTFGVEEATKETKPKKKGWF